MKYSSLLLMLFLLVSFQERENKKLVSLETENTLMKDKDFLLNYFDETEDHLKELTKDLSEAQMRYQPAEDSWSVGQVLEHIVLTEQALFGMAKEMMAADPAPERRSEINTTDKDLIAGIVDRSQKFQASPDLQPSGKYIDPEEAIDDLEEQREEILEFIKNTPEEDLRNHISDSPFGPMDAYQSLLFIAAHTARHTKQIEEVLADSGFPEK